MNRPTSARLMQANQASDMLPLGWVAGVETGCEETLRGDDYDGTITRRAANASDTVNSVI